MELKQVDIFNLRTLWKVSEIIRQCGNDMFEKYGLKHWLNSKIKTFLIVLYVATKERRKIYSVSKHNDIIATYQACKVGNSYKFGKFAVSPTMNGMGVGSECIQIMTLQALKFGCSFLECEVYCKSEHALNFYLKRGFRRNGEINTLKYKELKLIKDIKN